MDMNSLISNKKQNKHHEGEGRDESSIGICDLPDPILQLIISSLSTKNAVQTSVLSKRWVYLWRGISNIQLEEGAHEERQQFINFVRRLLEVYDCSNLKKFFLSFKVGEDAPEINEWLHGFINPKIQELNLDLEGMEEPLVFPVHLFTCATLTNFRLFPQHSSFSLVAHEELALYYCSWVNVKAVCISSPLLQKLIIKEREDDDDKSDEGYNIFGLNGSNRCHVVIVGTNLKSFSYEGDLENDYFLYSSTSVVDASILINPPDEYSWSEDWDSEAGYLAFKLLKELSNVEKLSISETALWAINSTPLLLGHLPLFCNLAELHLLYSNSPIELSCEALLTILRKSPCLQVVEIEGGFSLPKDYANNNYILDPLPMCFRENLKTIKIYGFIIDTRDDEELLAIKKLLQEASVLETFHISCFSYGVDPPTLSKRLKKLYKQIVRFPKGSTNCEIVLECIGPGINVVIETRSYTQ